MTYEELANRLTGIKKSLEDLKVSADFDEATFFAMRVYLRQAHANIFCAVRFLEHMNNLKKCGVE